MSDLTVEQQKMLMALACFRNSIKTTMFDEVREVEKEVVSTDVSGFNINWSMTNCGFGQFYMRYDEDLKRAVVDTETMKPENFVLAMNHLMKHAVYEDFEEIFQQPVSITVEEALTYLSEEQFNAYWLNYNMDASESYFIKRVPQSCSELELDKKLILKFRFKNQDFEKNEALSVPEKGSDKVSLKDFVKMNLDNLELESYYKTVVLKKPRN